MTSVSAGQTILTGTQQVGSRRTEQGLKPRPPDKESHTLSYRAPQLAINVIHDPTHGNGKSMGGKKTEIGQTQE